MSLRTMVPAGCRGTLLCGGSLTLLDSVFGVWSERRLGEASRAMPFYWLVGLYIYNSNYIDMWYYNVLYEVAMLVESF